MSKLRLRSRAEGIERHEAGCLIYLEVIRFGQNLRSCNSKPGEGITSLGGSAFVGAAGKFQGVIPFGARSGIARAALGMPGEARLPNVPSKLLAREDGEGRFS